MECSPGPNPASTGLLPLICVCLLSVSSGPCSPVYLPLLRIFRRPSSSHSSILIPSRRHRTHPSPTPPLLLLSPRRRRLYQVGPRPAAPLQPFTGPTSLSPLNPLRTNRREPSPEEEKRDNTHTHTETLSCIFKGTFCQFMSSRLQHWKHRGIHAVARAF